MSEIESTTQTESVSVDPIGDIANMLVDENVDLQTEDEKTESEDSSTTVNTDNVDEETSEEEVNESEEMADSEDEDESEEEVTWAGVLGVDDNSVVLDEEGNFKAVKTKVNGESEETSLKDLIAGYQNNKHNTQKSQALAAERKEFETAMEQRSKEIESKVQIADKLLQHLNGQLTAEFQNVDWARLRAEQPGEYAATMQDFQNRQNEINTLITAVGEERIEISDQQRQENQAKHEAYLKEQGNILIGQYPSWSDKDVAKKAFTDMQEFTSSQYGFTAEEFAKAYDARLINMIQDAMAYRKGKQVAKKKIEAKVPKFQKSTGRRKPKVTKLDKLTKAAKTATGHQKRALQTDAITELLIGNT